MNEATTIIKSETTSDDADGPAPSLGCDPDQPPEPMSDPPTDLVIQCASGLDGRVDLIWFETQLSKAISHIAQPVQRVVVKLVDDCQMTQLHQTHCNDKTTTDVLTFENSAAGQAIDVDIAICVDVANRQASKYNFNINQELLLYALHGLLHCAGFDDKTDEQSLAIHKEEDRILQVIGIGKIYKRNKAGHDATCDSIGRDRGSGS